MRSRGKSRSIVQPGQTLHHFFKRQRLGESKITSPEVIVIDSDDDDKARPAKRRRSDVDIDLTLQDWDDQQSFDFNDWMLPDNETIKQSARSNQPPSCVVTHQTLVACDTSVKPARNNAFSILMSSVKETEAWKEASIDKTSGPPQTDSGRRKAPFYKVLQGMPIAVDAFNFGKIPGVTAYFLTSVHRFLLLSTRFNDQYTTYSHAHSDHYTNLSSNWKNGLIYCSEGTANLIIHMLSVDKKWIRPLPMDTPSLIPNTNGVTVTLIEANHCPGSCLFFFEGPQTVNAGDSNFSSHFIGSSKIFRYLHCGDFRASPRHILHPAVHGKLIDHVYLDTTYLDPKVGFEEHRSMKKMLIQAFSTPFLRNHL